MIPRHEQMPAGRAAEMAAGFAALIPVLETERLTLRAPVVADFAQYADIACSERGAGIGGPMSRDDAWWDFTQLASNWMLHGHGGWTVVVRATGQTAGFVLLGLEPGDQDPELGYMLCASAEGHGYAAEAARAARDYGYRTLNLPVLVSYIFAGNARSVALAERLGAVRTGTLSYPDDDAPSIVYLHPRPENA